MESYKLIKLRNEPYDFLIIATSYVNPLDAVNKIVGKIGLSSPNLLFDLTLINGMNKNRYIEMRQSNKDGNLNYGVVGSISPTIKNISSNFFTSHSDLVDKSVIPNSLKFLLKKNYI